MVIIWTIVIIYNVVKNFYTYYLRLEQIVPHKINLITVLIGLLFIIISNRFGLFLF